jgi:hypothetical protein
MNIDLTQDKSFSKATTKAFISLLDGTVIKRPWETQICYKQSTPDLTASGRFDDMLSRELNMGIFRTWNDKWFVLGGRKEWRDMEYLLPIFIAEEIGGLQGDAYKHCFRCGNQFISSQNPICPNCELEKHKVNLKYRNHERTFVQNYFNA